MLIRQLPVCPYFNCHCFRLVQKMGTKHKGCLTYYRRTLLAIEDQKLFERFRPYLKIILWHQEWKKYFSICMGCMTLKQYCHDTMTVSSDTVTHGAELRHWQTLVSDNNLNRSWLWLTALSHFISLHLAIYLTPSDTRSGLPDILSSESKTIEIWTCCNSNGNNIQPK